MIREKTSLVTAHAEMINKDRTCSGWFRGWVEGASKGSKNVGDVLIEVAYFARAFSDELGLIVWQMS